MSFEIIDKVANPTIIKVIGVGGAGGNAVEHMINSGVKGVEFICVNTDAMDLSNSSADSKLRLGQGLGAGGDPDRGRELAISERARISDLLDGAHMVFITAGMGGGTGTGAAPVIAEVAQEMGILSVGVVTKPFEFEGKRVVIAENGVKELRDYVDSLIVILNDNLMEVLGEEVSMLDGFKAADDVLKNAVHGISEIINVPGLVSVDFEDVRSVLGETGRAMMGSAMISGVDRARLAADQAIASPLLEGVQLSGARGVLVNITGSDTLGMREVRDVMSTVSTYAHKDANVIFGTVIDNSIGDHLRVTVVATGVDAVEAIGVNENASKPELVHVNAEAIGQRTGTDNRALYSAPSIESFSSADVEGAFISGRTGRSEIAADMGKCGLEKTDIPAFLRKQAD